MTITTDSFLPASARRSAYATTVRADPATTWDALQAVTAGELLITGPLTTLRGLPARIAGDGAGFDLQEREPVLAQFLRGRFTELACRRPRLHVAGAIGQPWRPTGGQRIAVADAEAFAAFAEPGFVRMLMAFELEATDDGTRLVTDTRVLATDRASAAAFALYWRVIAAGSALIRLDLLRAIRRRAEATAARTAAVAA